jgi:deoxyribodipyrimidine photo-lyase
MKTCIFWFRRDLRLEDNTALDAALRSGMPVLPVFIFDSNILDDLAKDDPRVSFIYSTLSDINDRLRKAGGGLHIIRGDPSTVWKKLIRDFNPGAVYFNRDYEPYARERDLAVEKILTEARAEVHSFKDQVIFEANEILKSDGQPYTVFTPYSRKWLQKFKEKGRISPPVGSISSRYFLKHDAPFPLIEELGFRRSSLSVRPYDLSVIPAYHNHRNDPAADLTSYLSPHLRFGTAGIRAIVNKASEENPVFLNELIWREFFMQILYHFPHVVAGNFRPVYDNIEWRNDEKEFRRWCNGETGYPIVDAGMRQLNETGWMHNRVRMIVSGFLCKDLLIDWRWGEAYFAEKLLDYELSSNNGNWQWAAGTGCDAAPWFRIFNPDTQQKKFDPWGIYIKRWVPDLGKPGYPVKMVDHDFARQRAIDIYKTGIKKKLYK